MKDFIIVIGNFIGTDVYLSWDAGKDGFIKEYYKGDTYFDVKRIHWTGNGFQATRIYDGDGHKITWTDIDFQLIGRVYVSTNHMIRGCYLAYGEREDLMTVIHIIGELSGTGKTSDIIWPACEITGL